MRGMSTKIMGLIAVSVFTFGVVVCAEAAEYVGCYTDARERALPVFIGNGYDVDRCIQQVRNRGFAYAGLQWYGDCFAGNGVGYDRADDRDCNTRCDANTNQICGGTWRNSIYSVTSNPSPPGSQTRAGSYVGCYTDAPDRALPVFLGNGYDVDACILEARNRGYAYAGLQWHGECWAGNNVGYVRVDGGECNTPCDVNHYQICGGAWRNSIYSVWPNSAPQIRAEGPQGEIVLTPIDTNDANLLAINVYAESYVEGTWTTHTVAYSPAEDRIVEFDYHESGSYDVGAAPPSSSCREDLNKWHTCMTDCTRRKNSDLWRSGTLGVRAGFVGSMLPCAEGALARASAYYFAACLTYYTSLGFLAGTEAGLISSMSCESMCAPRPTPCIGPAR